MSWDREKERKAGKVWHTGMSVVSLIFGIFWCLVALSMGAWFMLIFGIPIVGLMAYRLMMLTKHGEEKPKQSPYREEEPWQRPENAEANGFCPYCGSGVEETFEYCPKCGRKLK